jgi:hypothetical protein
MDALIEAGAREARFNFLPGWCRHRVLTGCSNKSKLCASRNKIVGRCFLTVGEMHLSGNQMADLSYDSMVSYLTAYGDPDALKVARDLDSKVESLLAEAAG